MNGDLVTAYVCRAAAVAAAGVGVWLAAASSWWAGLLVLWLVPGLLLVGGLAHRAHTRRAPAVDAR